MSVTATLKDLVIANRILADHGVVDVFGHVSVRNPERPDRYFMARSRGPGTVTIDDLIEFDLEGKPIDQNGRPMYAERAIHSRIYAARPDVNSVCHNHSPATIPFGVTKVAMRPIFHMGAIIGPQPPVWNIADEFGDTNLLVVTNPQGDSLARAMGGNPVVIMRGHGTSVATATLRLTVFTAIYMQMNAQLLAVARDFGDVHYLSDGEIGEAQKLLSDTLSQDRAWNAWAARVGFGGI